MSCHDKSAGTASEVTGEDARSAGYHRPFPCVGVPATLGAGPPDATPAGCFPLSGIFIDFHL